MNLENNLIRYVSSGIYVMAPILGIGSTLEISELPADADYPNARGAEKIKRSNHNPDNNSMHYFIRRMMNGRR